jgi:hypothetical protein
MAAVGDIISQGDVIWEGKGTKLGDYKATLVSDNPPKLKIEAYYDTAVVGGGGDALHSFQRRKSDKFGGKMNTIIMKVLDEFYKTYQKNPKPKNLTVKIEGTKVFWTVEIEESTDNKAWVGFNSRGGAGADYDTSKLKAAYKREESQLKELISDLPKAVGGELYKDLGGREPYGIEEPKLETEVVFKYLKGKAGGDSVVRQTFITYTRPSAFPSLTGMTPSSVTGSSASTSGLSASTVDPKINDKLINGKIIITKKSGPGELTGLNEVELVQVRNLDITSAEFNSEKNTLQFTEAGDYVLSITCTDDRVEPYELKVKVTKEDEIIAQPESKGNNDDKKPVDGSRPIISQIDKPTIVVPEIKMDKDKSSTDQDAYVKGMGYTPLIWYHGFAIEDRSIKAMRLYHNGLVPMVEFTFEDTKDILKSIATPKDDATIDLFLNSTSKNLKSIHMSFKIKNFVQGQQVASQTYTVTGTVNIPGLYVQNGNSYNGTSFQALRSICKELGIGFNSNIKDTSDSMPWRNTLKKPYEFMDEIISRSYITDESYMAGYIDYYYCFNYVDIEKEMNRDASKDLGLDTSGMSEQSKSEESDRLMALKLTNDKAQNSSSNFIGSYTTLNESTKKSLQNGYATVTKAYDRLKKQFLVFTVESTTSDGSETHILNGAEMDGKYQKENIRHKFTGKIDTDNVHKDYNYAVTQNRINLNNLNKIVLNAVLPNANWNLYKFQKIGVDLISPTPTPTNPSPRDFRYSGYYIIADIEYIWNGKSMSQKLRLVKKELGKTPDEIKNGPPVQAKPEVKENNPNPVGMTPSTIPAPNSVYSIGQTYLVQDKAGKLYNLTVTRLLENGIEVTGTLTESPIGLSSSTTSNTVVPPVTPTGTSQSTTGATPSVVTTKPFSTSAEIKKFQDWLDSNYPTWLKNGKLNKGSGYGSYGPNTENAYKAYGSIYNEYLSKGMSASVAP